MWGARGGNGPGNTYWGGYGARMRGDFSLAAGSVIKILIGQTGGQSYGGGGDGTFVATSANVPLIVAGGGTGSDGCCMGASGSGGGYTGGPGSTKSSGYGGAGGSYNNGTNQSNDAGNTGTATLAGNGKCIITKL